MKRRTVEDALAAHDLRVKVLLRRRRIMIVVIAIASAFAFGAPFLVKLLKG